MHRISSYAARFAGRAAIATASLLLSSTALPALADQVYKSVDAQGHVTYSDRPTAAGAQKTDITVQQADPKEAQRLAKERMLLKAVDDQRTRKTVADEQAKAKGDSQKKQLCDHARQHYNNMKDSNRIYTVAADGNREYYTDAQADAMRTEAKRAMDAACGS
jgi:Domain of unknown function (DUF4124)